MKRRIFLIMLALLIAFGSAACSDDGEENSKNADWIWAGSNNTQGALTDSGYYYINYVNHMLCYADLSGGGHVILCSKVGCPHEGSDCEAYIYGFSNTPLFFWNDHIYYVDEFFTGALYRRDATGMAQVEIGTLGKQYIEEQKSLKVSNYAQAGQYLYYCGLVSSFSRDENGADAKLNETYCIGRIHLTSGKDEIMIEKSAAKSGSKLQLCAARDGEILFYNREGIGVPYDDPGYIEAAQQMSVTLEILNGDTGETTTLFKKTRNECADIQMVADGKVYYTALIKNETYPNGCTYAYEMDTGKEKIACETAFVIHYGGGYALCKVDEDDGYLLYEMKTGKVLPKEVSVSVPRAYAYSAKGFVLQKMIMKEDDPSSGKEAIYCYVTYASLADGLQEADLCPLYTHVYG